MILHLIFLIGRALLIKLEFDTVSVTIPYAFDVVCAITCPLVALCVPLYFNTKGLLV